jgi:hypothetical protein
MLAEMPKTIDENLQRIARTKSYGLLTVLRFAAALFECLVRHFADKLAVFNGTAARFHLFAGLSAHHLFCRSSETDWHNQKSSGDKRQNYMFHFSHLL